MEMTLSRPMTVDASPPEKSPPRQSEPFRFRIGSSHWLSPKVTLTCTSRDASSLQIAILIPESGRVHEGVYNLFLFSTLR